MSGRTAYFTRRLAHGGLVVLAISVLAFLLLHLGGDPAQMIAANWASERDVAELREKLGLNRPLHVQYGLFLGRAVRGDFGDSILQQVPALEVVASRLPRTAQLAAVALAFTIVVAVPVGVLGAVRRGTLWDRGGLVFSLVGQSVPSFWFGVLLISVFSVSWKVLPAFGAGSWQHLILPGLSLGLGYAGVLARVLRSSMLDVLHEDYVRTARAKGLPQAAVLRRHAVRNAFLPALTVLGLELGGLLAGSIITETVFAYPGMGYLAIQAIRARDFPVVLAFVTLLATIVVVVNLVVDVLYGWLDPRIVYA